MPCPIMCPANPPLYFVSTCELPVIAYPFPDGILKGHRLHHHQQTTQLPSRFVRSMCPQPMSTSRDSNCANNSVQVTCACEWRPQYSTIELSTWCVYSLKLNVYSVVLGKKVLVFWKLFTIKDGYRYII